MSKRMRLRITDPIELIPRLAVTIGYLQAKTCDESQTITNEHIDTLSDVLEYLKKNHTIEIKSKENDSF